MKSQILLSGIQPSGTLHIGNYLGAIKQWVELQKNYKEYIAIVDLHAITVPQEPKELYKNTLELAALLIACGIDPVRSQTPESAHRTSNGVDPKKTTLFIQSHVPAHTELGWILNTLTPIGELERMTQFKEKQEKAGLLAGLLNYPTLMAADILLYSPDVVPVGEDQLQHLELARTLARKFNSRFGETLKEPKALLVKDAARIMGLDDPSQKMSKSAESVNNYIALLDSPDEIRRKIKIAVTDSGSEIKYDISQKPAISNLLAIYSGFSGMDVKKIEEKYAGKGYAEFKKDLAEVIIADLEPVQKKYKDLSKNKNTLIKILKGGAKQASAIANKTLLEVKKKVGFVL